MRFAAMLAMALVTSCSLGGSPPKYSYVALTPPDQSLPSRGVIAKAGRSTNGRVVVVGPVLVPGYLEREQVPTRVDERGIVYSERDRWAEPVDRAFARVLRQTLSTRLKPDGWSVEPSRIGLSPSYSLQVELLRFERRDRRNVELWARWVLRSEGHVEYTDETRIREPTTAADGSAAAAALSRSIDRFSAEVAPVVLRLQATRGRTGEG